MNILQKIITTKKEQVADRKRNIPYEILRSKEAMHRVCLSMKNSLENSSTGIIAEFKRKSPSKGFINEKANSLQIVPEYVENGASVCSILTDEIYFGGDESDIVKVREVINVPILRKDFIIDSYQINEAKSMGADAILLIAACLEKSKCRELAQEAREMGLEVLLEIHNEEETEYIDSNVDMVGINNRDLKTFITDVEVSHRLSGLIPERYTKISESGLTSFKVVKELRNSGFKGFLIGETFMKEEEPGKALKRFLRNES